jgi:hypothetical protein
VAQLGLGEHVVPATDREAGGHRAAGELLDDRLDRQLVVEAGARR